MQNQLESLFSGLPSGSEPGPTPLDLLYDAQEDGQAESGTPEVVVEPANGSAGTVSDRLEPVMDAQVSQVSGSAAYGDDLIAVTPHLAISEPMQALSAPVPIRHEYLSFQEPVSQYRLQPDQLIDGRYMVIEPLGSGSFAEVYQCLDTHLEQQFAVKVMSLPTATDDVLREARTAARLQHANIVRVVNIGRLSETGSWYIVMDYKEGSQTLESVLDQAENHLRRLALGERTLRIVSEVAQALEYAHSRGIVHQDVKPTNIIIDREGHAYLTDFGLAMTKRPVGTAASMKTLGAQSGMSGTIPYMAPEEFEDEEGGRQPNPNADIYSLAVVIYEMLVGQLPYPGKATGPIIRQIVEGIRTPPRQLNAEIPREVESILLRSLSIDPNERCRTATGLASALGEAAQAYINDEELYEEARRLFSNRKWRDALSRFEYLESLAPAYKETRLFMERARKQVQLLDLYDDARGCLDRGDFESCMDKLDVLVRLDPAFEVTSVREQARLALVEKLYRQAQESYQAQEYQKCLRVFEEILARDPGFRDQENTAEQAQRQLKRQQYLKRLYDVSVEQTQREDWVSAQKALEELYRESPRYADVEVRLTMVRYIARLSRMYHAAQKRFESGDYTDCIARLDELSKVNNDYKSEQILKLHGQAAEALYDRSERLIEEGQYERAMLDLNAFVEHTGGGDPRQIRDRIQDGIAVRELNNRLAALYRRATGYLDARQYPQCLDVMKEIHRIKPDFADAKYVERRARDSLCSLLYAEALGALVRGRSKEAWEVWNRLRTVDPEYPDPQSIEKQIVRRLNRWSWLTFWKKI